MRLKTLLLFGAIGLFVSAPMLFNNSGQNGGVANQGLPGLQNNGLFQGQASQAGFPMNNSQPAKPRSFLSRIFGGGETTQSATPEINSSSPFQFAGSRRVLPNGTVVTTSPPLNAPPMALNQPVYQPFAGLNEFLRFDVSPNWVKSRWPRVSSFPGQDALTGLRVALVSGPRPVDIHGSLTYYFDERQRVQRIAFKGWTGDASELAAFVERAGFTRRNTNGAALFSLSSWGTTRGVLRLDHPPVSSRDLPNEQLMVLMELTNPNGKYAVSEQTKSIMTAMERGQ